MSERVQSIMEAVLSLTAEQRREFMEALTSVEISRGTTNAPRRALVESIMGKYRHIPTSSESFLSRKREDVALESQP